MPVGELMEGQKHWRIRAKSYLLSTVLISHNFFCFNTSFSQPVSRKCLDLFAGEHQLHSLLGS